jgi:hypothetical protein
VSDDLTHYMEAVSRLRAEKGGLVSTIEGLRHDMENAERRGFSTGVEAAAKIAEGTKHRRTETLLALDAVAGKIRALSPAPAAPQGEKEST